MTQLCKKEGVIELKDKLKEELEKNRKEEETVEKKIKETGEALKKEYTDLKKDAPEIVDNIKNSTIGARYFFAGIGTFPLALISDELIKNKAKAKMFKQGALVGASIIIIIFIINAISELGNYLVTLG